MCLPTITENAPRRVFSQFRECLELCISTTVAEISTMGQACVLFSVFVLISPVRIFTVYTW